MTTPDGFLSLPLSGLRDMLAASPAFQSWTGAADATDAQASVHVIAPDADAHTDYPESATVQWPLVILNLGKLRRNLVGVGNAGLFNQRIDVTAYIEWQPHSSDRDSGEIPAVEFLNRLGAVLADLEAASQQGGGLQILTYDLSEPARADTSQVGGPGDFYTADAVFTIGFR